MAISINLLKNIERILILVLAGALIYVVSAFMSQQKSVSQILQGQSSKPKPTDLSSIVKEIQPFDNYRDQFAERNIFGSSKESTEVEAKPEVKPEVVQQRVAFPDFYKIVGVIVGQPSEVVIEDTNLNQTIFLQEGEIKGDLELLHVEEESVMLNYKGSEHEILLN